MFKKLRKVILLILILTVYYISNKDNGMKFEKIKYIERKTGEIKVEKVMGEKALEFLYYNPFGKLA